MLLPVKNFKVKPYMDFEKLFPGFSSVIPNPQNEYARNSAAESLPEEKMARLIPTPFQCLKGDGQVEISQSTVVRCSRELEIEADYLVATVAKFLGIMLARKEGTGNGSHSIVLKTSDLRVNGISQEAYHLEISKENGITITGSDAAGVFYGIQSLLGLVRAEDLSHPTPSVKIHSVEIFDAPRFRFRGFLLDVSRNFQRKEAVLKLIDLLAFYKINVLDLRLTDDEGWRIEIKGLPELTRVGGRRGHALDDTDWLPPSFGSGPFPDAEDNHGTGYYSSEDFKEILTYADQRHVQIVPEICFPSHARAAIKSMEARFRNFMGKGDQAAAESFRLIDPHDQSVYHSPQLYNDNVACVALESTYRFYETVVRRIREMYREAGVELTLLHTGGDEVPQGAWSKSPMPETLESALRHPQSPQPPDLFFKQVAGDACRIQPENRRMGRGRVEQGFSREHHRKQRVRR